MFGLETLDMLIGLVTVYLVFGLACTAIVEAVAGYFGMRSGNLESALKELFDGTLDGGTPFVDAFYAHPLVQALSKGKDGRPSYIPSETVGKVVKALLEDRGGTVADAVRALPGTPETNRIKGLLDTLAKEAAGDAAAFRKEIEQQFDTTMERASGWFKRNTQAVGLCVAIFLVILANVDTVNLARSLASDPAARVKMVELAEQNVKKAESVEADVKAGKANKEIKLENAVEQTKAAKATYDDAVSGLKSAGLPFGWQGFFAQAGPSAYLAKIAGLVISIFAVSLGAPFWFDVLQRFMQVRAAGVAPKEAEKK